jgi:cysteinyl-tRNA synthetase
MLRTHYRQPIDWTNKGLEESRKTLDGWYEVIGETEASDEVELDKVVVESLADDLNTPAAMTRLHVIANEIRGPASDLSQIELKRRMKVSAGLLGLLVPGRRSFETGRPDRIVVDEDKVRSLIEQRNTARAAKNFARSDEIRKELAAIGVELEDHKDKPTTWKLKKASQ